MLSSFRYQRQRTGFTLVELLVVITIIALLIAMLVPTIQKVRESANRVVCTNNLRTIGQAIKLYLAAHGSKYPSSGGDALGTTGYLILPRTMNNGNPTSGANQDWGWMYQILPYLENDNLWRLPSGPLTDPAGISANDRIIASTAIETYFCPSRRRPQVIKNEIGIYPLLGDCAANDYAGALSIISVFLPSGGHDLPCIDAPGTAGFRVGYFGKSRRRVGNTFQTVDGTLHIRDISDGLSHTFMVAEKSINSDYLGEPQPGEFAGYASGFSDCTLRSSKNAPHRDTQGPIAANDDFGSSHPFSMNALFGDGSVRTISYSIADSPQALPLLTPLFVMRGIPAAPSPPNPPNSMFLTLFQRLSHRADGGTVQLNELDE